MIQMGIAWIFMNESIECTTNESSAKLYFPSKKQQSDPEKAKIDMSDHAVSQLKDHVGKCSSLILNNFEDWEMLQKTLLIWACNSFQGGHVY
jgi:hypothetical protein